MTTEFDDDGDYGFEAVDDADLTGLEPRFVNVPPLQWTPAELSDKNVGELVKVYVDVRNQLATDRKGYKAREARMKTFLAMVSAILCGRADEDGVDSFKTPNGTVFRRVTEKFSVSDWSALTAYLTDTHNYQVLQKRVSPDAVREIRAEDGDLPPGVGVMTEVEFAVRSPTVRK